MAENEFAEKLVDLKKQIGIMDIVIGRESLADFVIGCCYDEDIKTRRKRTFSRERICKYINRGRFCILDESGMYVLLF